MSELDLVLWIGVLCAGGIAVDTYFWIRTTLRLREFNQELQPRLATIDEVSTQLISRGALPAGPVEATQPIAQLAGPVLVAKNGREYVRTPDGMSRWLTGAEAKILKKGGTIPIRGSAPARPTPVVPQSPTQPTPPSTESPEVGDGDIVINFESAAAELTQQFGRQVSAEQVAQFVLRHVVTGEGSNGGGQPGSEAPPASPPPGATGASDLFGKLLEGNLTSADLKAAGKQIIAGDGQGGDADRSSAPPGVWEL